MTEPAAKTLRVFIENEAGSSIKHTFDEQTLKLLKTADVSAPYPFAYGFAVGTLGGDGDALDCFVVTDTPLRSGEQVDCIPVHLLEQVEDGEVDHKILCRLANEPGDIPTDAVAAIRTFVMAVFAHVPGKQMELGDLLGAEDARDHVRACRASARSRRLKTD